MLADYAGTMGRTDNAAPLFAGIPARHLVVQRLLRRKLAQSHENRRRCRGDMAGGIGFAAFNISDLLAVLVFAMLLLACVENQGLTAGLLNSKPLIWLGEISYSLYLIHGFIQFLARRLLAANGIADPGHVTHQYSVLLVPAMLLAFIRCCGPSPMAPSNVPGDSGYSASSGWASADRGCRETFAKSATASCRRDGTGRTDREQNERDCLLTRRTHPEAY